MTLNQLSFNQLNLNQLNKDEQRIYTALQSVIDPEIGENLIDLGLIYGIRIQNNIAKVTFSMTSHACPMSEIVIESIHDSVSKTLTDHIELELDLVWEPPWEPAMMSEQAKQRLGWGSTA
ncbi:hydroxylase [Methylotenera oryzisoli]|uniref:Hydroxylase n=1 Tax=Methylotenera oryzisoli TaxID=2080758 RepID=A0A4Y9VRP7_9PROT|nr:metal-sulfur cluster assembly factor [Methylotenera oryzisoli]TFW71634.1 hydroxylase [Methylotenera oryzisoli]